MQIQRQKAAEEVTMPLYDFACPNGHKFDRFLKLADYDTPQTCIQCGEVSEKQLSTPMFSIDATNFVPYHSPATGHWITSKTQRREDMKASGCVDYEPSLKAEQEKRHAAEDAALDKKVEEHVEREIIAMPVEKREKLAAECDALDVEVTRV